MGKMRSKMRSLVMSIISISFLTTLGCAGSSSESADGADLDLDIGMTASAKAKKKINSAIAPDKKDKNSSGIPLDAATNWRSFFKPPPTAKERSLLEQRLDTWKTKDTAADLIAKGKAELVIGRLVAAEASYRQALRRDSSNTEAMLELAALYLRLQRSGDAFDFLAQAKEAISTQDGGAQSVVFKYRYTLALAYISRGEREKGHKVLSDLIGIDKTFAPAYAALGASYMAVGRDAVAEFVVRRGLDRVQDSASLLNLLGVIMQKRKLAEEARILFDKALQVSPFYSPALVNRAVLSTESMEFSAAEEDLLQALKLDPQNVDALVALGVVQKRQGNYSGAKTAFSKAVDLGPDNPYARFNLGVLFADHLKRPNEAVRLFQEVTQTSGASVEVKDLARSYINELQPSAAR
jgi:tetratricopeptide (TPR) repeat protein